MPSQWNCEHITELPTPEKLGVVVDPDVSGVSIAKDWFESFENAIASKDAAAVSSLFIDDSFWRDMLTLTANFRTIHRALNIKALLESALPKVELSFLIL